MWKALFLNLILFSSIAFAQVQEKPKDYKFGELKLTNDTKLKQMFETFMLEGIGKGEGYKNVIKFYGTAKQILIGIKRLRRATEFICVDKSKLFIIDAGREKQARIEFWIISSNIPLTTNQ